ncbi:MAG: HAD family hydrolase, partial [Delftia sp.]|nr:HAD family hydrolase [Delftia sp.]
EGLARYHDWRKHTLIELPAERAWKTFILAERPAAAQKVSAAVGEDLTYYIETQYYQREMRPEIPQVLEAIKNMGLKMGVISNVQSQGQVPQNLEQYGIIQYFDPIVLTSVYGHRKPDPAVFYHAARRMGVPTGACLHIGDRISRDIEGARRAGLRLAVQIKHDFAPDYDDTGPAPDAVLDDMTGLLDILEAQLRRPAPRKNERVRAVLFDAGDILYFRPHKNQKLDAFLADLGLGPAHSLAPELKLELQTRAFRGELSREGYREETLKLYGVQGQENIERGKQIMAQETDNIQFFEGVREALAALKEQGLLLG